MIICCFLLYSGHCSDTNEALKFYGEKRTKDGKGVTIASQQRYIRYYEYCLKNLKGLVPKVPKLMLEKLIITSIPKIAGPQHVEIEIDNVVCFKSKSVTPKKGDEYEIIVGGEVQGDCKIQLWVKTERLCHFWINTGFYTSETRLIKDTIDVANKDKSCSIFKKDFGVTPVFTLLQKADSMSEEEIDTKGLDESGEKKPKKSGSNDDKVIEKPTKVGKKPRDGESKGKETPKDGESNKKEPRGIDSDKGKELGEVTTKDKRSSRKSPLAQSGSVKRDGESKNGESKKDGADKKKGVSRDASPKTSKSRDSKKGGGSSKSPKVESADLVRALVTAVALDAADEPTKPSEEPIMPEPTQEELPAQEDATPRTREHAKSFYKYSDYKEVIEKMRSGGEVSDDEDSETESGSSSEIQDEQELTPA